MKYYVFLLALLGFSAVGQSRTDRSLDEQWSTTATDDTTTWNGFEQPTFATKNWKTVQVPHTWDRYAGYRRKINGNRFGTAWYRKTFSVSEKPAGKRFFLYFEGVGSYATVWLNGKKVGYHAGGRTTFTLDVTDQIQKQSNVLAVRADHPDQIQDLPWVSGGSSTERGFSEGSQPMGIFRPVHLIITNDARIEPFGVHVWNHAESKVNQLFVQTELKNYGTRKRTLAVWNQLLDHTGKQVCSIRNEIPLEAGKSVSLPQQFPRVQNPHLWSVEDPYLYTVRTTILENGKSIDELVTPYGIRWIHWELEKTGQPRFTLNGKPVFINGVAEYEHLLGNSHAFSAEQIRARVQEIKAAGFNAFRDAHQPHNLRYHQYWDESGILWWTQMAAHIWYDTPEFRNNFKKLLVDWVKERRNSPSIVLWGLENESTLPEAFARECSDLIRSLDPTASSQRKITTCNGGKGTDWDVPQNWTGTYGGDPNQYAEDLKRQILVGEYGAWRTIDQHTEGPGNFTENRMTELMETKIRLAESVRDQVAGHFFWLLNSHDNPGRTQGGEGMRELDRIGPVNYKGLFTAWEEPTDSYYMFRSNYAPKETQPMVYLVSHTWPDRWLTPGKKDSIIVYSNCEEVELFNDVNQRSLGKRKRNGIGTHFQWDGVDIQYNVLQAVGYVNGKAVARDQIVLHHLPEAPQLKSLKKTTVSTQGEKGKTYLYRVNCGGPTFTDQYQQRWLGDQAKTDRNTWGSTSWTKEFPGMPAFFASQRRTFDPISGSADWNLFQTFRYGRNQLQYEFNVPDGEYTVELYFIEPWYGTGGGLNAEGWRLFDVAVNDQVVIKNLDIWKEVGHDTVLKKTVQAKVTGGKLIIHFPRVQVSQAIISAIAIASKKASVSSAKENLLLQSTEGTIRMWLDTGDRVYTDQDVAFARLPSALYGATWLQRNKNTAGKIRATDSTDVYVAVPAPASNLEGYESTGTTLTTNENQGKSYAVFRMRVNPNTEISVSSSHLVLALPVTHMEPAYDLKKATSYKATDAKRVGKGVVIESLMDKDRAAFKESSGNALEWTISVGVADTYSLTLKYHNPTDQKQLVSLEVILKDGTVVKPAEQLSLDPSKAGKWSYLTTNTGTMINAGTYTVRLNALNANRLYLDALDVQ